MALDTTAIAVVLVVFVSSLVRAVFGFGNSLVAMPLLAMTPLGMKTVSPLVALIATMLAVMILAREWRIIDFRSTWRLIAATLPGIPLGLLLLKGPYEEAGKIILALVIIGFSLYSLIRPRFSALPQEWAAYPFGFIAGILGGAYNSNGPPVVIYGTLRRWTPARFRANLQGYLFPTSVIIIAGHGLGGFWTPSVGWYLLISLPAILLAVWLGTRLNHRIPQGHFDRYVHILLILIGSLLLVRTVAA
ncbi:MAG: sulfite exporter TauE/SafE family protein [Thermodesulfobacteriota bacterium]